MKRFFSYTIKLLIVTFVMTLSVAMWVRPTHDPAGDTHTEQDHFVSIDDETFEQMAQALSSIEPAGPIFEPVPIPEVQTAPVITQATKPTWLKNAVAFSPVSGQPMIAIVIDDLGMNRRNTKRTSLLPGPLTMAFLPYADALTTQTDLAKTHGHELIVHMPMEPLGGDYAGPGALLARLSKEENRARLEKNLAAFDGYVGINNHMGSRFTSDKDLLAPVMQEISNRGLLFLDSKTTENSVAQELATGLSVPFVERDVFLDHVETPQAVARAILRLERIAKNQGYAVAIGHPKDVTLAALESWLPTLGRKGLSLVPLSAIVQTRMAVETQPAAGLVEAEGQ